MARFGVPRLGWLTATLLCLITFWVFWTLRYHGPESTLQQYHQAAARLDRALGESLTDPSFKSPASYELWKFTVSLMDQGNTRYYIARTIRGPNEAIIFVQYDPPGPINPALVWRLHRIGVSWLVDANQTSRSMDQLLRPYVLERPPVR